MRQNQETSSFWPTMRKEDDRPTYHSSNKPTGGSLLPFETDFCRQHNLAVDHGRLALNQFFSSSAGAGFLLKMLQTGDYRVRFPEEAALPVVKILRMSGAGDKADEILSQIQPFFEEFRFYPLAERDPEPPSDAFPVFSVNQLRQILSHRPWSVEVERQRRVLQIWIPLADRLVALLSETIEDGEAFSHLAHDWLVRARAWLQEYQDTKIAQGPWRRMENRRRTYAKLRLTFEQFICDPTSVTPKARRETAFLIHMLSCKYLEKRGTDDLSELRLADRRAIAKPLFVDFAKVLSQRLCSYEGESGLTGAEIEELSEPISATESKQFAIPKGCPIPRNFLQLLEKCRGKTLETVYAPLDHRRPESFVPLIWRRIAANYGRLFDDPLIGDLAARLLRAFGRMLSFRYADRAVWPSRLEIPWIAALEGTGGRADSLTESIRNDLRLHCAFLFRSFPHRISFGSWMVQRELRILGAVADMSLPLTTDLFPRHMAKATLSDECWDCARETLKIVRGSLYARYFKIIPCRSWWGSAKARGMIRSRRWFGFTVKDATSLTRYCRWKVGWQHSREKSSDSVFLATGHLTVVTACNLAILYHHLHLAEYLEPHLEEMVKKCFIESIAWDYMLDRSEGTGTALGSWIPLVFYLSQLPEDSQYQMLEWMGGQIEEQPEPSRSYVRGPFLELKKAVYHHGGSFSWFSSVTSTQLGEAGKPNL